MEEKSYKDVFDDTLNQLYEVRKGMQRKIQAQANRIKQLERENTYNHNSHKENVALRNMVINCNLEIDKLDKELDRVKHEKRIAYAKWDEEKEEVWLDCYDLFPIDEFVSYRCSNCLCTASKNTPYCPYCGAKMDVDE